MKLFIVCSKRFYGVVPAIKHELERLGHEVFVPNCMSDPLSEDKAKEQGADAHIEFKQSMYRHSEGVIRCMDGILVLNLDKDGQTGYIGGATFLEMYDACRNDKKIFLWNDIPEGLLADEIHGFGVTLINGDIRLIK